MILVSISVSLFKFSVDVKDSSKRLALFTRESLISAHKNCHDPKKREHVTPWIRESGNFKIGSIKYPQDYSNLRITVDEPEDLIL